MKIYHYANFFKFHSGDYYKLSPYVTFSNTFRDYVDYILSNYLMKRTTSVNKNSYLFRLIV